jgi:hypothetical protein
MWYIDRDLVLILYFSYRINQILIYEKSIYFYRTRFDSCIF